MGAQAKLCPQSVAQKTIVITQPPTNATTQQDAAIAPIITKYGDIEGTPWYWRGTAKRLIRINWIDIGGVQTIHRFGHQSGRGERSGGLSAAKIHDFPARVFLNRSQTAKNNKKA